MESKERIDDMDALFGQKRSGNHLIKKKIEKNTSVR